MNVQSKLSLLTFVIGKERFAINTDSIVEVKLLTQLTHVPRSSAYVEGIMNFRGDILTVINLAKKLNLESDYSNYLNPVIIVITLTNDNRKVNIGLIVEKVINVATFALSDILPVPEFGSYYNPKFLKGALHVNQQIVVLLDTVTIFSEEEVQLMIDQNTDKEHNIHL